MLNLLLGQTNSIDELQSLDPELHRSLMCKSTRACSRRGFSGGLSLLALAGGGLATAAMRRRREEEEAAAQDAA